MLALGSGRTCGFSRLCLSADRVCRPGFLLINTDHPMQGPAARNDGLGNSALEIRNIVAGRWHSVLSAGELDLENRHTRIAQFAARQLELEHAAKALVVEECDSVPVGGETLTPVTQRLSIVQPENLDVRCH
jgi:hypothetical protein